MSGLRSGDPKAGGCTPSAKPKKHCATCRCAELERVWREITVNGRAIKVSMLDDARSTTGLRIRSMVANLNPSETLYRDCGSEYGRLPIGDADIVDLDDGGGVAFYTLPPCGF